MRRLVLALALGLGATMATAQTHKGYELPPYTVARSDGAFELRDYGAHIVAEVSVKGSRDGSIGTGFRMLAGYIFGGNDPGEKVAMTTPVAQTPGTGDTWVVRFTMPAKYNLETLPKPDNAAIRLIRQPAERQVSVQFSGLRGDAVLDAKTTELRNWAAAQKLTITQGPHYYFYDGPMTLPWNRRNEVAFTVK